MIQIPNRLIPFGGFKAMAVWPFLFLRRDAAFTEHSIISGREAYSEQHAQNYLHNRRLWAWINY